MAESMFSVIYNMLTVEESQMICCKHSSDRRIFCEKKQKKTTTTKKKSNVRIKIYKKGKKQFFFITPRNVFVLHDPGLVFCLNLCSRFPVLYAQSRRAIKIRWKLFGFPSKYINLAVDKLLSRPFSSLKSEQGRKI